MNPYLDSRGFLLLFTAGFPAILSLLEKARHMKQRYLPLSHVFMVVMLYYSFVKASVHYSFIHCVINVILFSFVPSWFVDHRQVVVRIESIHPVPKSGEDPFQRSHLLVEVCVA